MDSYRAKGFVFRPVVTGRRNGRRHRRRGSFYWAQYRDHTGETVRRSLRLPNGQGITDKAVAESELRRVLDLEQRRAAGMENAFIEAASTPVRLVLARYIRHLRGLRRSRVHIRKSLARIKWLVEHAEIERLAHLQSDKIATGLDTLAGKDLAPKTINDYRAAVFGFCRWLVEVAKLLESNPVAPVPARQRRGDVRKVRRALRPDEARTLLGVAPKRAMFYRVQMLSGLRVGELRALQWRDVDLDSDRPAIIPRAETTKSKRSDPIPLQTELADALRQMRPAFAQPTDRIFRTVPTLTTFKADLARAGIPVADDQGRTLDRHALRTTFVTWLSSEAKADLRTAQRLARHTDPRLTLGSYTDVRLLDHHGAINRLPSLDPERDHSRARATGTHGRAEDLVVLPVVPSAATSGREPSHTVATPPSHSGAQVHKETAVAANSHALAEPPNTGGGGNRTPVP